jgi:tetratricopeptide (TPR) repeat protein
MRLMVALFMLLSLFQVEQVAPGDQIARAEAAYQKGNYKEAVSQYSALVDSGYREGALYYDLASAYFQLNDLGYALLNFRRAQQFIPRDATVNEALALIRARRVDIEPDESGLLPDLSNLTTGLLTVQELSFLNGFLWVIGCSLLSARILLPHTRRRLRIPLILCGAALLIGFILLNSRLLWQSTRPAAVVVDDKVAGMSGPGEHYLDLFELHAAVEVRIVTVQGSWVWVELPDERQAWIPATAIERVNQ